MEVPLSINICRCCLAPGDYKSLKDTFQWMGANENYGDMLKECFDVTLCDANSGYRGGICELCITQLRNASNFKKQVLKSDELFKQGLENNFKSKEVKIEYENDVDSDIGNQDDYFGGLETEEETEIPVKEEITIEVKSRKRAIKVPVKREVAVKKKKSEADTSGKGDTKKAHNSKSLSGNRKKALEEKLRRLRKMQAILELSNATPLRRKTGKGFACVYCPEVIADPADLKVHVLKDHGDDKTKYKHLKKIMSQEKVKLDVTALECSSCHMQMTDLTCLCDHMNKVHGKDLYIDSVDKILPFKLGDPDGLKCTFCSESFVSFHLLVWHMNIHYRNYVCKQCDIGFTTKTSLRIHVRGTHAHGQYPCGLCEKIFTTSTKRKDHEKTVHFGFKRNTCPYCSERFVCYEQRNAHIARTHGNPIVVYKCKSCVRTFASQKKLNRHIRKDHLMQRPHACTECDKRFFEKTDLNHHMLKHTKKRQFKCDICSRSYGRKSTLREHMKIHNNDRRFKCEKCLQTFVQKCSWRSHMRNRHDQLV